MKISSHPGTYDTDFILFNRDLERKKADLIVLILESQGIDNRVHRNEGRFDILVRPEDEPDAAESVENYFIENKKSKFRQAVEQLPLSSFHSIPAYFIMALLATVHLACVYYNVHEQMIQHWGASALFILQGETFRTITALFLHADARHLLGNLAGIWLFAAPVISLSGYGTGPFMLLFAGASGNLINAYFHRTAHLSIGASTAVMGAAGLMAAFQVTSRKTPLQLNNLVPVIAGAVLVAMLSHGERTDVTAHIFGFFCGLVSGVFFFPLNRTVIHKYKEPLFLTICTAILVSCVLFR